MEQVIRTDRPEWLSVFTALSVARFQEGGIVAARSGDKTGAGRRWRLSPADWVLLTVVYSRTNLTFRQVSLLFSMSKSAVRRVVDRTATATQQGLPGLGCEPAVRGRAGDGRWRLLGNPEVNIWYATLVVALMRNLVMTG